MVIYISDELVHIILRVFLSVLDLDLLQSLFTVVYLVSFQFRIFVVYYFVCKFRCKSCGMCTQRGPQDDLR